MEPPGFSSFFFFLNALPYDAALDEIERIASVINQNEEFAMTTDAMGVGRYVYRSLGTLPLEYRALLLELLTDKGLRNAWWGGGAG